jgi:hypothetical protein
MIYQSLPAVGSGPNHLVITDSSGDITGTIVLRHDTYANLKTIIGAQAELGIPTDNSSVIIIYDGSTTGGTDFPTNSQMISDYESGAWNDSSDITSVDFANRHLFDSSGNEVVSFNDDDGYWLASQTANQSIDFDGGGVYDSSGNPTINLYQRKFGGAWAGANATFAVFKHYSDAGNSGTSATAVYADIVTGTPFSSYLEGSSLKFSYNGIFAATSNNKRVQLSFAGNTIFDSGSLAIASAASFWLEGEIYWVSGIQASATLRCAISSGSGNSTFAAAGGLSTDLTGINLTATQTLSVILTGGATNDIVMKTGLVEYQVL